MIITVEELRHAGMTGSDAELKQKAKAAEQLVRDYTHNNFQHRGIRYVANVEGDVITFPSSVLLKNGDTVEISRSQYNNGVYEIIRTDGNTCQISDDLYKEDNVLVTLIKYPESVKNGVLGLVKWEKDNEGKAGIQSETISRHSVTYATLDDTNSAMGYPRAMMAFLDPYRKARF